MYGFDYHEIAEPPSFLKNGPGNDTLDPRIDQTRFIAYNILAPIFVIVGMIGNLITIIVLRLPQFRGVTYTLFFVLAISDLLSLFFCISMLMHLLQVGTRYYSTAVWFSYCEVIFTNAPMSTSTLIIVCITIDRYFSVCRPTHFKTIHTNRYARWGIWSAVIIAVVAWLPSGVLKEPKYYKQCPTTSFEAPDDGTWYVSCMKTSTRESLWYVIYSWTRQAITIFIPLFILIILNCLIVKDFVRLRRRRKQMMGSKQSNDSPLAEKRKRENQHLIHLLTAVMISFFITIVPSGLFGALYDEKLSTRFRFELFRALANDLEILNHALNFYLYILYSKPIRDAIANIFKNHQKKLSNRAASNIMVVMQKPTSADTRGITSQTETRNKQKGMVKGDPNPPNNVKNTARETQYMDLTSDNDSSFNQILPAEDIPNEKQKQLCDLSVPVAQENSSYFEFPLRNNRSEENIYLTAVVNHNNKPLSRFSTVVHTVEVHYSKDECDSVHITGVAEAKETVKEEKFVEENKYIPNTNRPQRDALVTKSVNERTVNVLEGTVYVPSLESTPVSTETLKQISRKGSGHVAGTLEHSLPSVESEALDDSIGHAFEEVQADIIDNNPIKVTESIIDVNDSSGSKDLNSYVNMAFECNENQEFQKNKERLPNGYIRSSPGTEEITNNVKLR